MSNQNYVQEPVLHFDGKADRSQLLWAESKGSHQQWVPAILCVKGSSDRSGVPVCGVWNNVSYIVWWC
jgi:hypothetical protein